MDENFLYSLFAPTGALVNVKIIRNKASNASEGYGFVEFSTHAAAEDVLRTLNATPIPNTDQTFRLNWAAFGVGKQTQEDHSVFVGDLAPDVTDYMLQEHFRQYYSSVRSAKVILDPLTNRSKGYGFVRFGSETERDSALSTMNGLQINNRPIRVSLATAKKNPLSTTVQVLQQPPHPSDFDPSNTTLFIGGLSGGVTEDQLRALFAPYGDIVYVKIPPGKGCGFVQYVQRSAAEQAMQVMQGQLVGSSAIRISWGRSNSNRTPGTSAAYSFPSVPANPYSAGKLSVPEAPVTPPYGGFAAPAAAPTPAAADPYGYYGSVAQPAADPAAYMKAFPGVGVPHAQMNGAAANGLARTSMGIPAQHAAGAMTNGMAERAQLFDPLAPLDLDRMNSDFMHKHQAQLVGAHLHA
eukprot:jgi/Astpho2/7277/Aster-01583